MLASMLCSLKDRTVWKWSVCRQSVEVLDEELNAKLCDFGITEPVPHGEPFFDSLSLYLGICGFKDHLMDSNPTP